jgi:hypothetical protein
MHLPSLVDATYGGFPEKSDKVLKVAVKLHKRHDVVYFSRIMSSALESLPLGIGPLYRIDTHKLRYPVPDPELFGGLG